jgi:hypothetical protein
MGFNAGRSPGIRISAPIAEVAYRHALKELLVEQARLTTQEREAAQQPFNLTS